MKNFTVRAFVLTLALAGIAATSVSAATTSKTHKATTSLTDPTGPAPTCAPNSGDTCGLD